MKKVFCDFCGEEIIQVANDWLKVVIKCATGIPDCVVSEQCCCGFDACYDCAKKIQRWVSTFKNLASRDALDEALVLLEKLHVKKI